MKLLKKLFDFYLDASIHVALAVYALVQVTAIAFKIEERFFVSWFAFFSTIVSYNFIKYGVEAKKYILVANTYQKIIQFTSGIAFVFSIYFFFKLQEQTYIYLVALLFLTAVYAIPVLPKAKNIRSLSGLKIFAVALVWAGTTVLLPIVNADIVIYWDVKVEVLQRFLLVLALLIPFEIRDLKFDDVSLKTLPQRWGVVKTKIFGAVLISIIFLLEYFKDITSVRKVTTLTILLIITLVMVLQSKKNQPKYYSSFWVEAIPILWWGMLAYFTN